MPPANWCPSCNTVLANEQVVEDGRCERCRTPVTRRDLNQWFFRITKYADELLDHSKIDWPEKINLMQTNWIGRSEGVEIEFDISESAEERLLRTFTTRIDTIFGVTSVVLAPEHPLVPKLTTREHRAEVEAYVEQARRQSEVERLSAEKEKTGVFTGTSCVNRLKRREAAHPGRRLRAAHLRHRRGDGGPGPRPAGLRIRQEVRPAHPGGGGPAGLEGRGANRGVPGGGHPGELRPVRRLAQPRRHRADRRPHRGARVG